MTTQSTEMPVRAVAPWFGAARLIAEQVGLELDGCDWVGVPFAGGMSELAEIRSRSIAVSDKHGHVINLARVISNPLKCQDLTRHLRRMAFHPQALREAQAICKACEPDPGDSGNVAFAQYYFVCCWMGRSHKAGTVDEFKGGLSMRWNANGGDSNTRYRSALRSIVEWQRIMRRCNFHVLDAFDFLEECKDQADVGIYVDPPFPDVGEKYRHKFSVDDHRRLALKLGNFRQARVVCRFYDHELIRELYPEGPRIGSRGSMGDWLWRRIKGRKQTNDEAPEVLILNGPSRAPIDAPPAGGLFA